MNQTRFINLTPHAIRVVSPNGNIIHTFPANGRVARVETQEVQTALVNGKIPVFGVAYGDITGLPEPIKGTRYIVSGLVKAAASYRIDLVSPHGLVRDSNGAVIGCLGLAV
jgi:hypothetical protein